MATSANAVWEVRTTGADTAGGAFVTGASGVDYSQQNAAQYALTGLASAGAGNVVLSAAAAADMVGNLAQVISGTNYTTGFFEITSVVVGVSITFATNNAAAAICTGVGAAGVINIGGAVGSPGMIGATTVRTAGNRVYIKAGTYTISTATPNISGGPVADATAGALTVISWEGYQTTRGDLGTAPVLQVAAAGVTTITVFSNSSATGVTIRNITVDGAGKTAIQGFLGRRNCTYHKLTAINCTNQGIRGAGDGDLYFGCSVSACTTVSPAFGITTGTGYTLCIASEAYNNTVTGFGGAGGDYVYCIAYGNTGATSDGFGGANFAVNCTSYGNGRNGFLLTSQNYPAYAVNCVAESNTGKGFTASATLAGQALINCAGYNNTGGDNDSTTGTIINFVTGTGSFFTNAAAANFALNNTAGAGAAIRGNGAPATYPDGLTASYFDRGAAQHQDTPSVNIFPIFD